MHKLTCKWTELREGGGGLLSHSLSLSVPAGRSRLRHLVPKAHVQTCGGTGFITPSATRENKRASLIIFVQQKKVFLPAAAR